MVLGNSGDLLDDLRADLGQRQIGRGMARLDELWSRTGHLDPHDQNSAALLCYVAQWVDAGWRDVDIVQNGLGAFPKGRRSVVRLSDYIHILMAEGMVWVNEERVDRALENFTRVLSIRHEITDPQLAALAHFWSARCHRKNGEYDAALTHTSEGYRLRHGCRDEAHGRRHAGSGKLATVSKGDAHATHLSCCRKRTPFFPRRDDYITRGNIQSSFGRMYRREGRYDLGIRHFGIAIEEYTKRDPEHRNLARTLANLGYVERLMALQHRKRIDADAAQRRRSEPELRRDYELLRGRALAHLGSGARARRSIGSTRIIAAPGRSASIVVISISTMAISRAPTTRRAKPTRSAKRRRITS